MHFTQTGIIDNKLGHNPTRSPEIYKRDDGTAEVKVSNMRSEYQHSSQDTINVNAETHSQFEINGGYDGVNPVLMPQMTPTLMSPDK